jgi:hypothetical protein
MNMPAFQRIDRDLESILRFLMDAFGGDGNGVAALWPDGKTRIAKSVCDDEVRSARLLRRYRKAGAHWYVFHTRRASVGPVLSSNCHPFQLKRRTFVLAHNGHDQQFAQWGRSLGITDSECIARTWSTLQLPLQLLADVRGVFIGFHDGKPFVVKGAMYTDLVALWDKEAILLASAFPRYPYKYDFAYTTKVGRCIATNEEDLFYELFASLNSPVVRHSDFMEGEVSAYKEDFDTLRWDEDEQAACHLSPMWLSATRSSHIPAVSNISNILERE